MTVSEFVAGAQAEAAKLSFVTQVLLVDQTDYAAKIILTIRPDLFIQLYANMASGTRGYTLIHRGQRIYGRDRDARGWHRHPVENPLQHETFPAGTGPIELADFFAEVQDILEQEQLL